MSDIENPNIGSDEEYKEFDLKLDQESIRNIEEEIEKLQQKYRDFEKAHDEAMASISDEKDPEIEKELMKEFVDQQNKLNQEIEEYQKILDGLRNNKEEAA